MSFLCPRFIDVKTFRMMKMSEERGNMLHGVLLIALFSCAAFYIGDFPWVKSLSFSPMIVGIMLGMLYANSLRNRLPATWVPGILFCSKRVLRLGIVLYGFRLTFQDVLAVGAPALLIDAVVVTVTICGGVLLGRLLKMDRGIALLTSVGSGICGAAAVLGAESTIRARPYKTAVAVSTVVIFGTISMFLYPVLYRHGIVSLTPEQMGIYTGATLHEVAHVVGAGNAMNGEISDAAIIVKMIRVMMLVPVLLTISYSISVARARRRRLADRRSCGGVTRRIAVPWFALGVRPVRGGDRVVHPFAGHFSADDGHDRFGSRDQYRKVQKGGRQAFRALVASVRVACGGRVAAGQIHGSRIDVGASDSRVSRA